MNKRTFKLGELFCGPGGIALGARLASQESINYKIEHTWASDYHEDTCNTYSQNIKPKNIYCTDVRELNIESLEKIDAFAYGFPCNDFSNVGEKKGFDGGFGPLYTYGVKVLNHFKPKFFIAENVGGLSSANEGKAFKKIIEDLEKSADGYNITVHLYKFEDYGIPQKRHRIIIVGIDKKFNLIFKTPKPTFTKFKSAKEAIDNPPIPENSPNNELTLQSKTVVERLKHIKPGQNIWQTELPKHLQLNVKGAKLSQIYKRLHPDEPSYTITGSGGGGTHGYHWAQPRALTNRERARIQTFPDDFIFCGQKESVRRQIGMAVSPEMSKIIFESIFKTFDGIQYPSIEPKWTSGVNIDNSLFDN